MYLIAMMVLIMQAALPANPQQALAPQARYNPGIPTIKQVVGHDFGTEISTPDQIGRYLKALATAAPQRTHLVEYAKSWEGRPLFMMAIGTPERIAQLPGLKEKLRRLADPRKLSSAEADPLVRELPVVTMLVNGVHGNESPPRKPRWHWRITCSVHWRIPLPRLSCANRWCSSIPCRIPTAGSASSADLDGACRGSAMMSPWPPNTTNPAGRTLQPLPVRYESRLVCPVSTETRGRTRPLLEWVSPRGGGPP